MKARDKVKYTVSYGDEAANHVAIGTVITGEVAAVGSLGVDIKWDKPEITGTKVECGMPVELFEIA